MSVAVRIKNKIGHQLECLSKQKVFQFIECAQFRGYTDKKTIALTLQYMRTTTRMGVSMGVRTDEIHSIRVGWYGKII